MFWPPCRPASRNPWSALAGHCWAGPAPGQGTETHCFESVYGGQHIRDRHSVSVDGRVVYSGETLYSAAGEEQPMNALWIVAADGYAVQDKPGTSRIFKRAD